MGVASYKNEIKTIFLVINTAIAVSTGLFPLSMASAIMVSGAREREPGVMFGYFVVGIFMLALVSLGHYAAIVEKRAALRVFAAVMGFLTFAELFIVTKFTGLPVLESDVFGIFFTAISLLAAALAVMLAKHVGRTYPVVPPLGATPTAPTAV